MVSPAGASSFVEFVQSRTEDVEKAVRREGRAGGVGDAELPTVLVENSSRCTTNAEGEKVSWGGWGGVLVLEQNGDRSGPIISRDCGIVGFGLAVCRFFLN